jgi:YHS domain-containing protein
MMGCQRAEEASAEPAVAQATCPVMGQPVNKDIHVEHDGRKVYFCCEACVATFKADPEKYMLKLSAMEAAGAKCAACEKEGEACDKCKVAGNPGCMKAGGTCGNCDVKKADCTCEKCKAAAAECEMCKKAGGMCDRCRIAQSDCDKCGKPKADCACKM